MSHLLTNLSALSICSIWLLYFSDFEGISIV